MILRHRTLSLIIIPLICMSCATRGDIRRIEAKVDMILLDTNRSTLEKIFGTQASIISQEIEKLDDNQQAEFAEIQKSYVNGQISLDQVQEKMFTVLGGNEREVSTPSGVYLRTITGQKVFPVPRGTVFMECLRLKPEELPSEIKEKPALRRFAWGRGTFQNASVIFPWEFTISSFTREIVEATARRTAEEFIRMGGDKKWSRPVHIQVSTPDTERLTITTEETETQVYVVPPERKSP